MILLQITVHVLTRKVQPAFSRVCMEGMSLKFCNTYIFRVHPNVANARLSERKLRLAAFQQEADNNIFNVRLTRREGTLYCHSFQCVMMTYKEY